ncbi:uncharacterized protein LOC133631872 [Entelurus aequoreus]|uniref:uncharacterized protein LOC133631872 n=1 Tax=Entelurus aequoreus TaxID=161455 RepID=UPI002B1CF67E|nr:uncharacterized protein LOC133631872 [Entelurus aequoreus]
MLKELVKERLMAAADEIFALFERTIASYEEELSRRREKERHRQQLEAASKSDIVLHIEDVQQMIACQEERPPQSQRRSPTLKQEAPQPPHIKEEEEELWITQEREYVLGLEEADLTKLPLTGVSVKTEAHEEKPPESSQLHHSPREENRGAEPPSCRLIQHMTTKAAGDHCGGSQADNLLAPLSDSEDGDTNEPLSSDTDREGDTRSHIDRKHSKPSKKKTASTCQSAMAPTAARPGRFPLSLDKKMEVIEMHDQHKMSARSIARMLGVQGHRCGRTQVLNIIKRRAEWIQQFRSNVPLDRKRRGRKTANDELNAVLYEWFKDAAARTLPLSGKLLQDKARELAAQLGLDDFKASNGWLGSFRRRHSIVFGVG